MLSWSEVLAGDYKCYERIMIITRTFIMIINGGQFKQVVLFDDFVIYDPSCFSFLRYKWCINSLEHCMAGPERFTNIKQLKIQDTSDTYKIYFVGITNKFCKNNKYILSVFCLHMKCILSQQILPCCSRKAVDPEKQRAEHLKNILNEITC